MHWEIVPRERLQKCWLGWDCGFFPRVRYRSDAADGDQGANMYIAIIYNFFAARFEVGS
jgi:hypothetical protein